MSSTWTAAAESRIEAGRLAPGIGMTFGDLASSQAMATWCGLTPYAETMGAFKDLYDEGVVQRVGLSNANPDQIREAHGILGAALVSVQNQLSPSFRTSEPELDLCNELGLAFLPWSPLGGMSNAPELGEDFRPFAEVAERHGVSPHQVAVAWLLAKSPNVVPIPGASRPASILDCAEAVHLELGDDEFAALEGRAG